MSTEARTAFPKAQGIPIVLLQGVPADPSPSSSQYLDEVGLAGVTALGSHGPRCGYIRLGEVNQLSGEADLEELGLDELTQHVSGAGYQLSIGQGPVLYGLRLASVESIVGRRYLTYTLQTPIAASGCLIEGTIPLSLGELSSTAPGETAENLRSAVKKVLDLAEVVEFEDGVENAFTQQLAVLVRRKGSAAVEELATILFSSGISSEVVGQTLLCLGRIDDDASYLARSLTVQLGLSSSSSKVRDAAAVGMASLRDPHAKDSLARAIEKERIRDLKDDMKGVLSYLEAVG